MRVRWGVVGQFLQQVQDFLVVVLGWVYHPSRGQWQGRAERDERLTASTGQAVRWQAAGRQGASSDLGSDYLGKLSSTRPIIITRPSQDWLNNSILDVNSKEGKL